MAVEAKKRKRMRLCSTLEEINETLAEMGRAPLYGDDELDFLYTVENMIDPSVSRQFTPLKLHCACKGNNECCAAQAGYMRLGRVRRNQQQVVECSDCACGPECPTRVLQKGRQVPLAIFKTNGRGWGLKTLARISQGAFIGEYTGQVITMDEANKRLFTYQFAMGPLDEAKFVVDAYVCGNEMRFLNHSCEPNVKALAVLADRLDGAYQRIGLFARKNIEIDQELLLDYGNESGTMECRCSSHKCRGSF